MNLGMMGSYFVGDWSFCDQFVGVWHWWICMMIGRGSVLDGVSGEVWYGIRETWVCGRVEDYGTTKNGQK